jgi:hypothetical protein
MHNAREDDEDTNGRSNHSSEGREKAGDILEEIQDVQTDRYPQINHSETRRYAHNKTKNYKN